MKLSAKVKSITRLSVILLLSCIVFISVAKHVKPRIIVTQDGEGDDKDSMVRFLMYSCDFEVVGIVENNSIFQQSGHSKEQWIQKKIDAYAQVLDNLRVHNPDYPDATYLKSVIKLGNENPGDLMKNIAPYWKHPKDFLTKDTPGSDLIIKTLLDDDPRIVHVPSWGGANTTAWALWKIKTTMPDKWERAASRIYVYCICYNLDKKAQDGGIKFIIDNMPEVKIFQSAWWSRTWNYDSHGSGSYSPPEVQEFMKPAWLNANVKTGHGPLGAMFGQSYVSEGDTPAWLALIKNGLEQHVEYTMGGWAGRPVYNDKSKGNWFVDGIEDPSKSEYLRFAKAFYRWIPDAQNDYAARMDWCLSKNFSDANHAPVASLNGTTIEDSPIVQMSAKGGETIQLDASGSIDPDKNNLSYKWWVYDKFGTYGKEIPIQNATSAKASITIPSDAANKSIQVVLEVIDDGKPSLKGYRRALINDKDVTVPVVKSNHAQQSSMKMMAVHKAISNGMISITLPEQLRPDTHVEIFNLSGKSLSYAKHVSEKSCSITYRANGVTFLKMKTNDETKIVKVLPVDKL